MPGGSGLVGSWTGDLAGIEGDIVTITADIILIFALLVDIDVVITNIETMVEEIHESFHVWERWFQPTKQSNPPTHVASRIGLGIGQFSMDAGNDAWGSWIQLLGSDDTPNEPGKDYYELHELTINTAERDEPYFIQLGFGVSGAQALIDGTYTEDVYTPESNKVDSAPIELHVNHVDAGTMAWARCMCEGQNTAALSFYFAIHEFDD